MLALLSSSPPGFKYSHDQVIYRYYSSDGTCVLCQVGVEDVTSLCNFSCLKLFKILVAAAVAVVAAAERCCCFGC